MSDLEEPKPGVSRRTVAKGMAWVVPAVAVAATVPLASASPVIPPPPVINFGAACGNTGAAQKGCGGDKTLQVPLTLTNLTGADVVFQITGMFTCNCTTAPTAPGSGVAVGVRGVWQTPSHSVPNQNNCTATIQSPCPGGIAGGSVLVPNGTNAQTYWIESTSNGSSSTFSTTINWRMLDAATCVQLSAGQAQTASAISPANCDG